MKIHNWSQLSNLEQTNLLLRPQQKSNLKDTVAQIVTEVQKSGDSALFEYTKRFDKVELGSLQVTEEEFAEAENLVPTSLKEAIQNAIQNVMLFHKPQYPDSYTITNQGIRLSRVWKPIESVGFYIPAGTAPLISTLIMLACPSNIAQNPNKFIVTPPAKDNSIHPAILYTAQALNCKKIFKIGGAQAIAALAYGTQTIPKVDKIFGPGNAFVAEAKSQVSRDPLGAAIDMVAGPSEVLVVADGNANPSFIASDLLSQAEHDSLSQVICISDDLNLLNEVIRQVEIQVTTLKRKEVALVALSNSKLIKTNDIPTAIKISNQYAPEHLILHLTNDYTHLIQNAGSVFVGAYTPESLGDYASGTNHVLPTYGFAKTQGGVSVESFMKSITFQEASLEGLNLIAKTVQTLAKAEGLDAHANAISIRTK